MQSSSYENDEVRIFFGEFATGPVSFDGSPSQKFAPPAKSGDYFKDYLELIKFCKEPEQPPHVQQVHSSDGWLCQLYILPRLAHTSAADKLQIEAALKNQRESLNHSSQTEIKEQSIGSWTVWQWRFQLGKTRLDHFLVFGTKYNYLFVSSPYGDRGEIPELIGGMQKIN